MKLRKLTYGLVSLVIIIVSVAMLVASCAIPAPSRPITDSSSSASVTTVSTTSYSATTITSTTTAPTTTTPPTTLAPIINPNLWDTDLDELMEDLRRLPIAGDNISYNARILRTPPVNYGIGSTTDPAIIYNTEDLCTFLLDAATGWQWTENDLAQMRLVYNDDFFHDKILIAGVIGLPSGSIQVGISGVTQTQTKVYVDFSLTYPQLGTNDMMSWHYFVEVSALDAAGRTPASNLPPSTGN